MRVAAGELFTATLPDRAPSLPAGFGARIEEPGTGVTVQPFVAGVLTSGDWAVEMRAPSEVGEFLLVWDSDVTGVGDAYVPLVVERAWRPTVQDVADLTPAFTSHPFGTTAGTGTYDDETEPTAAEVEGYIDTAVREVEGRVGTGTVGEFPILARQTATWHAAAAIEAEKAPQAATDSDGGYGWKQASYVACLKELVQQARNMPVRLT